MVKIGNIFLKKSLELGLNIQIVFGIFAHIK